MGLLKNLLKNKINEGIGKGISDAVGKAVEKVVTPAAEKLAGKAAENINETTEALSQSTEALKENGSELEEALKKLEEVAEEYGIREEMAAEKTAALIDHGTAAYFEAVIAKGLPDIQVRKAVSLSSFVSGVPEKAAAVDLLLFKDGRPAVGILLVPKNSYDTVAIVNTMKYLEINGVKALRFMREFSNEAGYVVSRIKDAL